MRRFLVAIALMPVGYVLGLSLGFILILIAEGREVPAPPTPPPSPPAQVKPKVTAPTQPPSRPAQVSMKADDWYFQGVANMNELSPQGPTLDWGWKFSFPNYAFGSNILFTTASPVLAQGHYIKMVGEISDISFEPHIMAIPPVLIPPARPPLPFCRVYFQQTGDDLSGQGQYAYYRWWSTKSLVFDGGTFVQLVGLEPEFWSTLMGERGDASAAATAGFQRALGNAQSIGIICNAHVSGDLYAGDSIPDPYADNRMLQLTLDSFAVCDPLAPSAKQENEACAPRRVP